LNDEPAARRFGLCTTAKADARNNDGYLIGMLKARMGR
jgi:hypothetical protein